MSRSLFISNTFAFKTSLEIAQEITFSSLPSTDNKILKELVERVPSELDSVTINVTPDEKQKLLDCISSFKQSKTFYWTREDFLTALKDVERQCKLSN